MDKYTPRVSHQLLPAILVLIFAGLSAWFQTWEFGVAFVVVCIMSTGISLWISWAGKIREESDYWMWVGDSIVKLQKADPEIWEALGFRNPPRVAKLEVYTKDEDKNDEKFNEYYKVQFVNVPISPAMLETFANGILSGRQTLSESSWSGIIPGPKYRKFQDWMEKKLLISKINPDAPTQGYILTEKGETWLVQYASASIVGVGGLGYMRKIPVRSDREVA